jgi:hypothetical protein
VKRMMVNRAINKHVQMKPSKGLGFRNDNIEDETSDRYVKGESLLVQNAREAAGREFREEQQAQEIMHLNKAKDHTRTKSRPVDTAFYVTGVRSGSKEAQFTGVRSGLGSKDGAGSWSPNSAGRASSARGSLSRASPLPSGSRPSDSPYSRLKGKIVILITSYNY